MLWLIVSYINIPGKLQNCRWCPFHIFLGPVAIFLYRHQKRLASVFWRQSRLGGDRRDGLSWVTDVTTLQGDWTGLLSLVSAVLLSSFILLLLPSSSVSLSNFYLAVPMRRCLRKHSCMSSPFPIAILNGTCSLRALILFCGDVPAIKTTQTSEIGHNT